MASSLLNLVNNLSEEICQLKSKYKHGDTKCETCGIRYKVYDCFYEYRNYTDDLIK